MTHLRKGSDKGMPDYDYLTLRNSGFYEEIPPHMGGPDPSRASPQRAIKSLGESHISERGGGDHRL